MVSQFGSLGYTIMGKTADLTVVQKTIIDTLHKEDNISGVLPGLRRRRNGLMPSGPKFSFQMRASFVFHLETKVLESGGRVEKLIAQVA
ncbi:DNA mismatch repair protein MutL [Labeo rohita]|uniref:DNA mismatch repair protein MutL n=1 Tax=Labeo rohita TaxID=84645 RepID=A0ABQ8LT70_LABRO|nr:DNA mismatch repair protein MutL [Labeo rohita]